MDPASITLALVMGLSPPPAYDYEPPQKYWVLHLDEAGIRATCGDYPLQFTLGCARVPDIIFVLKGLSPEVEEEVLRHERAHLNGWPAEHPQ